MEKLASLMRKSWYIALLAVLILWQAVAMAVGSRDSHQRRLLENSGAKVIRGPSNGPLCFISCLSDQLGPVETVVFQDGTVTPSQTEALRDLSCCIDVNFYSCTFDDDESAIYDLSEMPVLESISFTDLSNVDVLLELMVDFRINIDKLHLHQVTLTDAAIDNLARLPRLRILSLWGVKMPEGGKRRLEKISPHLIIQQSK